MNKRTLQGTALAVVVVLLGAGGVLAQGGPTVGWWVIAGGGGPSSGADVSLNDTVGQPVIGVAAGSGVSLNAGYWVACVAAPAVAPVVTVARSGADVVLIWPANSANVNYQVWVSTSPYFNPDAIAPTAVTTATTYTDAGAAASQVNHFYIVRGLNACAAASASSARKGEFTYGLAVGTP